ncbi:MAG: hypothetical protein LUI14_10890 [Lachnospiraceae bacterium]|nr:hypothetical protein [Lachnospiraceae bacterium]
METKAKEKPRRIFVSSPYRPTAEDESERKMQLASNIRRATIACKFIALAGMEPLAPHLYFTQFLDDSDAAAREQGMKLGEDWLAMSDEVWAFTGSHNNISEGMLREINQAEKLGIKVRVFTDPEDLIRDYLCYLEDEKEDVEEENSSAADGAEREEDHE